MNKRMLFLSFVLVFSLLSFVLVFSLVVQTAQAFNIDNLSKAMHNAVSANDMLERLSYPNEPKQWMSPLLQANFYKLHKAWKQINYEIESIRCKKNVAEVRKLIAAFKNKDDFHHRDIGYQVEIVFEKFIQDLENHKKFTDLHKTKK